MPRELGPKVLINYRRDDTSGHTGRIYDRLVQDLGKESVCMDVDTIPFGHDFAEVRDEHGQRRLDDPDDWVRIELAVALRRGIPVVPVLVDGATLPKKGDLPAPLEALPKRQALVLTERNFHRELDALIRQIRDSNATRTASVELSEEARREPATAVDGTAGESDAPRIIVHEKTGIELVRIEGGTFLMGAPEGEEGSKNHERPQHQVTVSSFYLGKYPVTNEQYARYLAENPKATEPKYWGDRQYNQATQPVVGVSWEDAARYAEWAGLRLPTEAEWEYACRAGTEGPFCSGDTEADLDKVGWYGKNSGYKLHVVGEKAPNAWGLYDMHGNVWEWCADCYKEELYAERAKKALLVDPLHDEDGCSGRVVRGGSFDYGAWVLRSAVRFWLSPDVRDVRLGFRCAGGSRRQPG